MKKIFETFKPKNLIIRKYVDYYYLDIKPNNVINEFQCFPHYNSTISLYKSHIRLKSGEMKFEETARPFQIFTPIRKKVLNVKQSENVYRIVIVFHPLGVQQFYENLNFSDYITDYEFFTQNELKEILSTTETKILTNLLDRFLEMRFKKFENNILEKSVQYIFNHYEDFSVEEISNEIRISRQHLNRIFQSYLGVSIKKFHEIVLFRQTINKKLFEKSHSNFTELAYEFNFNDQSHFNKTYKKIFNYYSYNFNFLLKKNSTEDRNLLKNEIRQEILDSIKKNDLLKSTKHTFNLKKGKKVIVYDNNTWEYSTNNNINKLNTKKVKSERSNSNTAVNSFTSNKNPKRKNKKKSVSNSSSYSSGTCGYPTKSGGRGRRTVKSGGSCWQHG